MGVLARGPRLGPSRRYSAERMQEQVVPFAAPRVRGSWQPDDQSGAGPGSAPFSSGVMDPPRRDRQPCLSPTLGPHDEDTACLAPSLLHVRNTRHNDCSRVRGGGRARGHVHSLRRPRERMHNLPFSLPAGNSQHTGSSMRQTEIRYDCWPWEGLGTTILQDRARSHLKTAKREPALETSDYRSRTRRARLSCPWTTY